MSATVIAATRRWIESVVIGLNLCPFARRPFQADAIRYVATDAADADRLLRELADELRLLASSPSASVETTVLIHPRVLADFLDYNDFLDRADGLIDELGMRGAIQIASFHPDYRFADADPDAVENYTNRSPYPMLHLLREASVSAVANDAEEMLAIPRRNAAMLRGLGRAKVMEMLKAIDEESGRDGEGETR